MRQRTPDRIRRMPRRMTRNVDDENRNRDVSPNTPNTVDWMIPTTMQSCRRMNRRRVGIRMNIEHRRVRLNECLPDWMKHQDEQDRLTEMNAEIAQRSRMNRISTSKSPENNEWPNEHEWIESKRSKAHEHGTNVEVDRIEWTTPGRYLDSPNTMLTRMPRNLNTERTNPLRTNSSNEHFEVETLTNECRQCRQHDAWLIDESTSINWSNWCRIDVKWH